MKTATQERVRWKRTAIRHVTGGVAYESTCGRWRVFRECPKTRRGRPLRRWWYVLYRGPYTGGFLFVGQFLVPHSDHGAYRFKTRRVAEEKVRNLMATGYVGDLNHMVPGRAPRV